MTIKKEPTRIEPSYREGTYTVRSKKGKNLGKYKSRRDAAKRLQQVEYFGEDETKTKKKSDTRRGHVKKDKEKDNE